MNITETLRKGMDDKSVTNLILFVVFWVIFACIPYVLDKPLTIIHYVIMGFYTFLFLAYLGGIYMRGNFRQEMNETVDLTAAFIDNLEAEKTNETLEPVLFQEQPGEYWIKNYLGKDLNAEQRTEICNEFMDEFYPAESDLSDSEIILQKFYKNKFEFQLAIAKKRFCQETNQGRFWINEETKKLTFIFFGSPL